MEMKKLLESLDECGMNEMPGMPPAMPPQEVDKGNPVSMNVSINASVHRHRCPHPQHFVRCTIG